MKKIVLLMAAMVMLWGCHNGAAEGEQKKGSSGKTLELLVVANDNVYCGDTKAMVDSIFRSLQEGLPEPEARFDVVNIPVSSFESTEMFQNHRNVLLLDVKEGNPNKVYKHVDQYAAPQVVFDFAASSPTELQQLLRKYADAMLEEYYRAEHRRIIKAFKGMENREVNAKIRDQFGFGLMFSNEFSIAKQEPNFAWVRKEAKDFGIGVLVWVRPYKDRSTFEEQSVLDNIDTIMKRHVPASKEGSYTGVERRRGGQGHYLMPITQRQVTMEGSEYCVETRGCWRSFGDYMGGPFVCYTMLSDDGKQIITLMGYVYCPRNKPWTKRDLLMQVESICWSMDRNK